MFNRYVLHVLVLTVIVILCILLAPTRPRFTDVFHCCYPTTLHSYDRDGGIVGYDASSRICVTPHLRHYPIRRWPLLLHCWTTLRCVVVVVTIVVVDNLFIIYPPRYITYYIVVTVGSLTLPVLVVITLTPHYRCCRCLIWLVTVPFPPSFYHTLRCRLIYLPTRLRGCTTFSLRGWTTHCLARTFVVVVTHAWFLRTLRVGYTRLFYSSRYRFDTTPAFWAFVPGWHLLVGWVWRVASTVTPDCTYPRFPRPFAFTRLTFATLRPRTTHRNTVTWFTHRLQDPLPAVAYAVRTVPSPATPHNPTHCVTFIVYFTLYCCCCCLFRYYVVILHVVVVVVVGRFLLLIVVIIYVCCFVFCVVVVCVVFFFFYCVIDCCCYCCTLLCWLVLWLLLLLLIGDVVVLLLLRVMLIVVRCDCVVCFVIILLLMCIIIINVCVYYYIIINY